MLRTVHRAARAEARETVRRLLDSPGKARVEAVEG